MPPWSGRSIPSLQWRALNHEHTAGMDRHCCTACGSRMHVEAGRQGDLFIGVRAGKLVHSGADQLSGSDYSLVDYNRAGVPLLEVVSEPDMASGAEAVAYAGELRRMMLFMGLTEGVMADGHLRFDVNVSVRARPA